MADVQKAVATFEANIERQTGKPIAAWVSLIKQRDLHRHGEIVAWLKDTHFFSHSHANQVAKRALQPELDAGAAIDRLFAHGKEQLRPIYDKVVAVAQRLGPDVSFAPKKANVSLRRSKQFALLQPSTKTRLDVGLILKDTPPSGRLEPSGSFNPMFTHRVRIGAVQEIDAEFQAWLRTAYDQALR